MIGFVTWPPFLYLNVVKVAKYAINYCILKIGKSNFLASADISFWSHMPVNNVASDWPRTFLCTQVFLFSILNNRYFLISVREGNMDFFNLQILYQ